MDLLRTESITIERPGTRTNVDGVITEGAPTIIATVANIQPIDLMNKGAMVQEIEREGIRTTQACFMYTVVEPKVLDKILRTSTNQEFKVLRIFNYSEFGLELDHYRSVIYLIEV